MIEINDNIFKAYDIRGVYGRDFDEQLAYRLGRAFAELLKSETGRETVNLGVSQDMRLSSPILYENLIKGILEQGVNVMEFGLVATPTFYFGVAKNRLDGGIQVSASHNPPEYNGFKLVRDSAMAVSSETGIMTLKQAVKQNEFPSVSVKGHLIGKVENLLDEQVVFAIRQGDVTKIKPFKIVVDSANAVGGPMIKALFDRLPVKVEYLNFELDGSFPAHEADPLKDKNNQQLQNKVLESGADLGVALDGDGDRIFFIDNQGRTVEPAIVRGILAKIFLQENPGATICYDIRPGKITEDMIVENGGKPVVTRVGHSLIKEKAREVNAIFAGESSGHYFVKLPFGFFEEPLIVVSKFLIELSIAELSLSEYIKPLQRYFHSGEINFGVNDKQAVFNAIKEKYGDHLQYDFDGLSFVWEDWWFNVRASNTENVVRLNLESVAQSLTQEKVAEITELIKQFD